MTTSCDVLIVGAGPTGATLANLLALYGVRVIAVEKNLGPGDEPRAISVAGETLRTMQTIGVLDKLAEDILLDTGARYYGRKGQLIAETRPDAALLGHPGKSQIDQPIMEGLLTEALQRREGATLHFASELVGIREVADGVTATLRDVIDGAESTIHASWVIACDGGRSPVRKMLGVALEGKVQEEKWVVMDVLEDVHTERFAEFHGDPQRPTVVVPGVKGRCRYEVMLFAHEDEADAVKFERITEYLLPFREIRPEQIRRASVYIAHQRVAERYRVGRVVLCGDAGHLMPPFAGQGLNAGMRDATNLAWKLAEIVRGTAGAALLDTYETERRPHVKEMIKLSVGIGRLVMTDRPLLALVRDIAVKALGALPALKRYVAGMRFVRPPHLTDGVIVRADPSLPAWARTAVGRSVPQPMVRDGKGGVSRLDELLGNDWAAVIVGGQPHDADVERVRGVLGTTRIGSVHHLLPVGPLDATQDHADVLVDVEGLIATPATAGPAQPPVLLLIRPDRYIAAASNPSGILDAIAALAPLVDLRAPDDRSGITNTQPNEAYPC